MRLPSPEAPGSARSRAMDGGWMGSGLALCVSPGSLVRAEEGWMKERSAFEAGMALDSRNLLFPDHLHL